MTGKKVKSGGKKRLVPALGWAGKLIACICLILVLAVAGAVITLRRMVTPEVLKSKIIAALEDTFQRPVSIEHVTLVLHQGIKISGLQVEESAEFPGKTFLSSEFLLVKLKLLPLLRRRVELGRVLLMNPRIHLVRRQDGVWNLKDMLVRNEPRGGASRGGSGLPPLHSAEKIEIERGELRVRDIPRRLDLRFEDFSFYARDFNLKGPFPVRIHFSNSSRVGGKRLRADLQFEGTAALAAFEEDEQVFEAETLVLVLDGHRITAEGTIRGLSSPRLDLKLRVPALDSKALSWYRSVPEGIAVPASEWELSVEPAKKDGEAPTLGVFRVQRLAVAAGGLRLSASGRLDLKRKAFQATIRSSGLPLAEAAGLYGGWAQKRLEGKVTGSLALSGAFNRPRFDAMNLRFQGLGISFWKDKRIAKADLRFWAENRFKSWGLEASRGTYVAFGNALSDIELDFDVREGDMAVRKLLTTWNGSRISLHGCIERLRSPEAVYFDGTADHLRIDELYSTIENIIAQMRARKGLPAGTDRPWATVFKYAIPNRFPDLIGRLRINRAHSPNFDTQNLETVCDLRNISKGLEELDGHFRIGFGPGRVSKIPEVQKAHPLTNVLLIPYVEMVKLMQKARLSLDNAVPETLDFTRTFGEFGSKRGLVDVRYMHFDSGSFVCYGDGVVDFPKEDLDLHVLARIPRPSANLSTYLVDTQNRPSFDISLKKNLNSPEVEFHTRKMKASDIEDGLAVGLKRVTPFPSLGSRLSCGR